MNRVHSRTKTKTEKENAFHCSSLAKGCLKNAWTEALTQKFVRVCHSAFGPRKSGPYVFDRHVGSVKLKLRASSFNFFSAFSGHVYCLVYFYSRLLVSLNYHMLQHAELVTIVGTLGELGQDPQSSWMGQIVH